MLMKNKCIRRLRPLFLAACVVAGYPATNMADDTDIYLNPSVPVGSEPLVMFVLDWRPSLGSTVGCDVGSYCDDMRADGYLTDGSAAGSGADKKFFDVVAGGVKEKNRKGA